MVSATGPCSRSCTALRSPLLQRLLHPIDNRERLRRADRAQTLDRAQHVALHLVLAERQFDLDLLRDELESDDRFEPRPSGLARVLETPGSRRNLGTEEIRMLKRTLRAIVRAADPGAPPPSAGVGSSRPED